MLVSLHNPQQPCGPFRDIGDKAAKTRDGASEFTNLPVGLFCVDAQQFYALGQSLMTVCEFFQPLVNVHALNYTPPFVLPMIRRFLIPQLDAVGSYGRGGGRGRFRGPEDERW